MSNFPDRMTPREDCVSGSTGVVENTSVRVRIPITLSGQFTASVTSAAVFYVPSDETWYPVSLDWSFRATSGTIGVATLDLHDDGTTLLSAATDISSTVALAKESASFADVDTAIAGGSKLEVDFVITGGTSPTFDDVTGFLTCRIAVGEEVT